MLRRLAMLVGLVLAGLAALVAYLSYADLGLFKNQLLPLVSASLGREVRVEGPLSLRLGRTVQLRAERLTVEDAAWAVEPTMLRADRLSAEVDLWSLVRGPLHIERLAVQGATLRLEVSEEGDRNWSANRGRDTTTGPGGTPARLPHIPDVAVNDVRVLFAAPALTGRTEPCRWPARCAR